MELTKEQFRNIDQFLKDQKVRYIDLRLELSDHIATEIESNLFGADYDQVLSQLPKRYNVSLLRQITEKKAHYLSEFWDKELKQFWKSYLTVPKVIFTLFLISVLFLADHIEITLLSGQPTLLVLVGNMVSLAGILLCVSKSIKAIQYKALLFEQSLYSIVLIVFLSGTGIYELANLIALVTPLNTGVLFYATYTAFQIITLIGLLAQFPKFINSKMEMTYG